MYFNIVEINFNSNFPHNATSLIASFQRNTEDGRTVTNRYKLIG